MTEEQDKIVRFDEHSHSFNLPDTDFKAEVVASGLKEAGYDAERTLIFRRGDIRRGFSKDIHDIHPEYSHYDLTDYLYLYVNRRSLYDELPEGIFHKNLYQSEKISKEQVLDEIRIHREEEFVSIFSGQWPVLELLPTHLAVMLVHMLAYMEQITASLSKTGECMTILTGVPVHIKRGDKCVVEVDPCLIPKLGSCILGDDMVLGNSFADGTYQMLVEIGPLSARRMESFFPGAADSKILNALTELFLPSDKEIQIRYIIQQEDARFRLGTPTEQGAYLGISTYL